MEHIYPIFDQLIQRQDRERLLRQRAKVVWLTGLSGSGKSTLAQQLERQLHHEGFLAQVLDGDNIRAGINNNLGFSEADRMENIRRIAEVAKLYLHTGVITINAFISPSTVIRQLVRDIVGPTDFLEIFVDAPLELCEQRDVKGLYAKARSGVIRDFTGINAPWEPPAQPDLLIPTGKMTIPEATQLLYGFLLPHIQFTETNV